MTQTNRGRVPPSRQVSTRQNINFRLEREFTGGNFNVRLDIPIIRADIPDMSSQEGLGDLGIRLNYRYKNTPGHSALIGATITLDTAAADALGDDTTKITGIWVNSWRKQKRLFSIFATGTWSESGKHDSAGIGPLVAYQPMMTGSPGSLAFGE